MLGGFEDGEHVSQAALKIFLSVKYKFFFTHLVLSHSYKGNKDDHLLRLLMTKQMKVLPMHAGGY